MDNLVRARAVQWEKVANFPRPPPPFNHHLIEANMSVEMATKMAT